MVYFQDNVHDRAPSALLRPSGATDQRSVTPTQKRIMRRFLSYSVSPLLQLFIKALCFQTVSFSASLLWFLLMPRSTVQSLPPYSLPIFLFMGPSLSLYSLPIFLFMGPSLSLYSLLIFLLIVNGCVLSPMFENKRRYNTIQFS